LSFKTCYIIKGATFIKNQAVFNKFETAMEKYKYSDLTGKIIRSSMNVHSTIGNGFQEKIYQKCLAIELNECGILFKSELPVPLFYKEELVGYRRVDFLVEDKVLVEIKATSKIEDVHFAQIINYLNVYKLEVGLLINFGEKSLRFRRFVKS
jgi:GxxExxY protein